MSRVAPLPRTASTELTVGVPLAEIVLGTSLLANVVQVVGSGVGVTVAVGVAVEVGPGVGVGPDVHSAILKLPMRVFHDEPEVEKYSVVNQKVQSSVGSTVISA